MHVVAICDSVRPFVEVSGYAIRLPAIAYELPLVVLERTTQMRSRFNVVRNAPLALNDLTRSFFSNTSARLPTLRSTIKAAK